VSLLCLQDINLNVVSAEVDTVGNEARDEFFITYHGEPLTTPMVTLVTNALQYYLSLSE
jgi:UTP:GlnB (protein PII) uridylyltransferase